MKSDAKDSISQFSYSVQIKLKFSLYNFCIIYHIFLYKKTDVVLLTNVIVFWKSKSQTNINFTCCRFFN